MEVYLAIERILLFPEAWPEVEHKVRRSLIKRFPLGILYNIQNKNKSILILVVMNLYKEPGYWKRRIQ